MKLYVAGSGKNIEQVKHVILQLREWGHEITYDWTEKYAEEVANPSPTVARNAALADEQAIRAADCVVFVYDAFGSRGKWVELGIAIATGTPVVFFCKCPKKTKECREQAVFCSHPAIHPPWLRSAWTNTYKLLREALD